MPKLAANLSWIYQEVPFMQRFGAAAALPIAKRVMDAYLLEGQTGAKPAESKP